MYLSSIEFLEAQEFHLMALPERMIDEVSLSACQDTKGRPLCPFCGKSFFDQSNRNRHLKMQFSEILWLVAGQTDELVTPSEDYICDVCGKTFCSKVSMTSHRYYQHRTHRHYECPQCNHVFTRKPNLQRHLRHCHSDVSYEQKELSNSSFNQ
ncbi:uncharacterized protein LOC143258705 isoform X2 [Tachypleus tridentatus]|uniref:uncharacterized protein LOC143258705 isoform X2 n=2 Tax=Tachypleus tridentatus TaxID=6853 RepID=UPI003FCEFFD3